MVGVEVEKGVPAGEHAPRNRAAITSQKTGNFIVGIVRSIINPNSRFSKKCIIP
jgi:hypothetical protein